VTAGIPRFGKFLPQVEAGTMQILAVSTADRSAGTDAPTLVTSGYDVIVQNWRMVAAAPGLSNEQKAAVQAHIETLVNSAGWKSALENEGSGQQLSCLAFGQMFQGGTARSKPAAGSAYHPCNGSSVG
jgi:putative tricarboxylic transport membrane protein